MTRRTFSLLAGLVLLGACKDATGVPDLNNVSSSLIASGLNKSSVQLLTTGLLNQERTSLDSRYLVFSETMARDLYRIDPAENRFITELVGHAADPGGFVGGSVWTNFFVAIRAANTIIDNIKTAKDLSAGEQSAIIGLGQTVKAQAYYRALELRDSIGIAVDVNQDISKPPAPFVCKPNALAFISALLDSASTNLVAAGTAAFPVTLPSGFRLQGDYSTPSGYLAYNRGLKGKVELYRGLDRTKPNAASFATAITALNQAIGTLDKATLNNSIYYTYSTAPGETSNPLVDQNIHLNPSASDSIATGDLRAAKIVPGPPSSGSGVRSTANMLYTITSNATNRTRPLPVLKISELILLRAQARIETGDLAGATADINFVRQNDGGLAPYAAFTSKEDARSAVLYEKRYSLLFESAQRLVDLRAYSRLNATFLKKETGEDIFQTALPVPQSEVNARGGVVPTPTCN